MTNYTFDNTYNLSEQQLQQLDEAEDLMLKGSLGRAEEILLSMLNEEPECIPVLSNLGHMYGRHLSDSRPPSTITIASWPSNPTTLGQETHDADTCATSTD